MISGMFPAAAALLVAVKESLQKPQGDNSLPVQEQKSC